MDFTRCCNSAATLSNPCGARVCRGRLLNRPLSENAQVTHESAINTHTHTVLPIRTLTNCYSVYVLFFFLNTETLENFPIYPKSKKKVQKKYTSWGKSRRACRSFAFDLKAIQSELKTGGQDLPSVRCSLRRHLCTRHVHARALSLALCVGSPFITHTHSSILFFWIHTTLIRLLKCVPK